MMEIVRVVHQTSFWWVDVFVNENGVFFYDYGCCYHDYYYGYYDDAVVVGFVTDFYQLLLLLLLFCLCDDLLVSMHCYRVFFFVCVCNVVFVCVCLFFVAFLFYVCKIPFGLYGPFKIASTQKKNDKNKMAFLFAFDISQIRIKMSMFSCFLLNKQNKQKKQYFFFVCTNTNVFIIFKLFLHFFF